jgi:lipopolysaccharide/colanic/teichoic acid biosynthesis glycosyltransferase
MSRQELAGVSWINSKEKRAMDVAYCIAIMPAAAIAGAIALGLSRVIDGKGADFSHQRIGQGGKPFALHKVRTLSKVEPYQPGIGVNNSGATALGRILRPLGIDELPQISNILKGEMSIVGPRAAYTSVFESLQVILPRKEFDEWEEAYSLSKPGVISSFGIEHRLGVLDTDQLSEQVLAQKARLDIIDFRETGPRHDHKLLLRAGLIPAKLLVRKLFDVKPVEIPDDSSQSVAQ